MIIDGVEYVINDPQKIVYDKWVLGEIDDKTALSFYNSQIEKFQKQDIRDMASDLISMHLSFETLIPPTDDCPNGSVGYKAITTPTLINEINEYVKKIEEAMIRNRQQSPKPPTNGKDRGEEDGIVNDEEKIKKILGPLFAGNRFFGLEIQLPFLIQKEYIIIVGNGIEWNHKKGGNLTLAAYFGELQSKNMPTKRKSWKRIEKIFKTRNLSQIYTDYLEVKKGIGEKWKDELIELENLAKGK